MLKKDLLLTGWRIEMDTPVKVFVQWLLCRSSNEKPQLKVTRESITLKPNKNNHDFIKQEKL